MAFVYPSWILKLRRRALDLFNRYSAPRWLVLTADLTLVFLTFIAAYLLRFNFNIPGEWLNVFIWQGLIATAVYALFCLIFKSYTGLLRHTTLTDITLVFIVTSCSALVLVLFSFFAERMQWNDFLKIPHSIILIHYVVVSIVIFAERIIIKMFFLFATRTNISKKRVLLYGAGELGFVVKRVIMSDPRYGFHVSGFIDDDKSKQGKKINGIVVYSPSALSAEFIEKNRIDSLVFAIKSLSIDKKSSIIRKAVNWALRCSILPKWINGFQANCGYHS